MMKRQREENVRDENCKKRKIEEVIPSRKRKREEDKEDDRCYKRIRNDLICKRDILLYL